MEVGNLLDGWGVPAEPLPIIPQSVPGQGAKTNEINRQDAEHG